jgi:hypothetical protein
VSNKLAALRRADTVVLLEGGRVSGTGPFQRLLADCPSLGALYPDLTPEERR